MKIRGKLMLSILVSVIVVIGATSWLGYDASKKEM